MEWYYILLLVYLGLAVTLFIFPCCKKKNPIRIPHPNSPCVLGGHRGGSYERLENSAPAFIHSKESKMHLLEMDVHFTKDKKIVVTHDSSLERLCDDKRNVEDVDFADLPETRKVVQYPYLNGYYHLKPGVDDYKIPLLRKVMEQNPGMPMNIEFKANDTDLMIKVVEMIREFKREDFTYIGSTFEDLNIKAKELVEGTGIRTFASTRYTIFIILFYFLGVLPFVPFRHWSVWYPFFGDKELENILMIFGDTWWLRILLKLYTCVTFLLKPMFWHLRRKGVQVVFFVVDREEEVHRALTYPIDCFITEAPEKIRKIVDNM